jgi:NAD(P)-dependent dehydrogenase (short-subunit alcohol dehydrogenase family)
MAIGGTIVSGQHGCQQNFRFGCPSRQPLRDSLTQALAEGGICIRQGGETTPGRIVNMGSLAGKEGLANLAAYSAASAGVIAFTRALSREVRDTNIRANCVVPGPIDTALIRTLGETVVVR